MVALAVVFMLILRWANDRPTRMFLTASASFILRGEQLNLVQSKHSQTYNLCNHLLVNFWIFEMPFYLTHPFKEGGA